MRSPSSPSGSDGGSSGSSDSDAADPHQAAIERRRARSPPQPPRSGGDARGGEAELVVHYVDEPPGGAGGAAAAGEAGLPRSGALRPPRWRALREPPAQRCSPARRRAGAASRGGAAREGTPEGGAAGADAWVGESEEMRRLLRAPRYYDDDFEAVRHAARMAAGRRARAVRKSGCAASTRM
jgi:hypothetical protein